MKNLQMPLKRKWFEMTKAGLKTEDYREINKYWIQRLMQYLYTRSDWKSERDIIENIILHREHFEQNRMNNFRCNVMTLGYPGADDTERILKLEHKGIEIRTGNPEWGAEPNKIYFVIIHGSILNE